MANSFLENMFLIFSKRMQPTKTTSSKMRRIPCASLLPKNGTNLTAAPKPPSHSHAAKLINTGLPLPKLTMPSATEIWFAPARAGSLTLFKESGISGWSNSNFWHQN